MPEAGGGPAHEPEDDCSGGKQSRDFQSDDRTCGERVTGNEPG